MACKQAIRDASLNQVEPGCGLFESGVKFANISISEYVGTVLQLNPMARKSEITTPRQERTRNNGFQLLNTNRHAIYCAENSTQKLIFENPLPPPCLTELRHSTVLTCALSIDVNPARPSGELLFEFFSRARFQNSHLTHSPYMVYDHICAIGTIWSALGRC